MKPELGTVSWGTLKSEDLLRAFTDELRALDENGEYSDIIHDAEKAIADKDWDSENTIWIINEDLFNALNDFAPPYCYFGSAPGDGADFGFWPCVECVEDDVQNGEILQFEDWEDVPEDYEGYIALLSDHGNLTLYERTAGKDVEIWGVV